MSLEGKKIVLLVESDFEDVELSEPLEAMQKAGANVTIVGPKAGTSYEGKKGKVRVKSAASANDISIEDFDAVIIPGGYAPDKMRLHQPMIDLVKRANEKGMLIAAVCHAPQLLISAEIVKGRRMTSWPSVAIDLKNAGAEWVNEKVVRDGNLITSRQPADLPAFNDAIIFALQE